LLGPEPGAKDQTKESKMAKQYTNEEKLAYYKDRVRQIHTHLEWFKLHNLEGISSELMIDILGRESQKCVNAYSRIKNESLKLEILK
jgi:hypothetical protein